MLYVDGVVVIECSHPPQVLRAVAERSVRSGDSKEYCLTNREFIWIPYPELLHDDA